MAAPVCNIFPTDQPGDPQAKKVPTIPIANDLASALAAINAIRAWINAQQQPQAQQSGSGGRGGGTTIPPPPKQPQPKVGRWNELNRTTEKVKITDPSDPTVFVEVNQLTSLTMQDSQTKETWVWHL